MKIFVHPFDAAGHVNSCVGIAQALAQRGHKIYFVIADSYAGEAGKYDFEEILLRWTKPDNEQQSSQSGDHRQYDGHLHVALARERERARTRCPCLKSMINDEILRKFVEFEPQFKEALEREKPDLIVADVCHFMVLPSIMNSKAPWVLVHSSNPILAYNSPDLPPHSSGYPTFDRTEWSKFDSIREGAIKNLEEFQNKLFKRFNFPEVKVDSLVMLSPYLNIYGYPEELDYTDLIPRPSNYFGIDAFARVVSEPWEFPVELKRKIKPGDKLVFVSLGTIGSTDVELMKKIVGALKNTPHKYIVSKGVCADQFELPENMWGEGYLPQTLILPLVDLVITHGGNNTVTESFFAGKPMVVLPLFSDQFDNAQRVQEKGFGLRVDPCQFKEHELVDAVNQVLNDQQVQQRMQLAAQRIEQSNSKDRLCQRLEQLVEQHKSCHI